MFKLNENFLKDVGLEDIPQEQREELLKHIGREMDERIGKRMSGELSDGKFEEFVKLSDGNQELAGQILAKLGDYKNSEEYKALVGAAGGDKPELAGEYASIVWIVKNIPNYGQIVNEEVDKLVAEIRADKDKFLAGKT